ncbi:MAG: PhoX family protein [Gammaproteobacteria bacterium]|nr:PhoX family protein [Gammaproteobacteria bacterium]
MKTVSIAIALGMVAQSVGAIADEFDFGKFRDRQLFEHAEELFGIERPLSAASSISVSAATAEANPLSMVTLARGLRARVVSSQADLADHSDMLALWPDNINPTHLIVCNEQGLGFAGVQRVNIATGAVATILSGTTLCDPAHVTPWGTVIIAEENGASGRMFEILDPLNTTGVTINNIDNSTSDPTHVIYRPAVGRLSFEGVAIYPNGVMYYGDENRPSKGNGGGAYYKFIPTNLWGGGAPITNLNDSPLAYGQVYGLRLGKRNANTDYGHGTNIGLGVWVTIDNTDPNGVNLRAAAATYKLTGYYRPEDIDIDGKALTNGQVRFCANNTGNEAFDRAWGETICVTDGSMLDAATNAATPEVQYFVMGNRDFSMMDNIVFQPGRGNWVMHEDRDAVEMIGAGYPFNDSMWVCLEDGADADTLSDGCVRIATMNDFNTESTGGVFDASGKRFFFSLIHNVTGHGTILEVTGWK